MESPTVFHVVTVVGFNDLAWWNLQIFIVVFAKQVPVCRKKALLRNWPILDAFEYPEWLRFDADSNLYRRGV